MSHGRLHCGTCVRTIGASHVGAPEKEAAFVRAAEGRPHGFLRVRCAVWMDTVPRMTIVETRALASRVSSRVAD